MLRGDIEDGVDTDDCYGARGTRKGGKWETAL